MRNSIFRRVLFGTFRRLSKRRFHSDGWDAGSQTANINEWRFTGGEVRKVESPVGHDTPVKDVAAGGGGAVAGQQPKGPAGGQGKRKFAPKENRTSRHLRCDRCNCWCTEGKHKQVGDSPCEACCIKGTITRVVERLHPSGRMVESVVEVPRDRGHRSNVGRRNRSAWLGQLASRPELARRFCLDHDWRLSIPIIRVTNDRGGARGRSRPRAGPSRGGAPVQRVTVEYVTPTLADDPEFPCLMGCGRMTYGRGACSSCRLSARHPVRQDMNDNQTMARNQRVSRGWTSRPGRGRGRGAGRGRGRGRGDEN